MRTGRHGIFHDNEVTPALRVTADSLTLAPKTTLWDAHYATGIPIQILERQTPTTDTAGNRHFASTDDLGVFLNNAVWRMQWHGEEERLAADPDRVWTKIRAGWGRYHFVDVSDPHNIVAKIRIRLKGPRELVTKIRETEDKIEKHLAIPGFRIDVEFVEYGGRHVHDVKVRGDRWTNWKNWNPNWEAPDEGPYTWAHEILHLMGLPDEYNRSTHGDNPQMSWFERKYHVLYSKFQDLPPDAAVGIMDDHYNKPLRRHIEAITGITLPPPNPTGVKLR